MDWHEEATMSEKSTAAAVTALSTAECWHLLERQRLGRLALVDAAGEPRIYPVNFASLDGVLYIRSANDSKLRFLRTRPTVAFEVDGHDGDAWWSVVVRGEAARVERDAEIRSSRETHLRSMSPTPKPYVIRIHPGSVTGRRFRERADDEPDVPGRSQLLTSTAEELPPAARRPHPIPSFTPLPEE